MSSATEPPSLIVRAGLRISCRAELVEFAVTLQRRLTGGRPFHCLLTDDAELRRLNRQFRAKNKLTDVLSFPAGIAPAGSLGDIAVSIDRARVQARDFGHRIVDEVRILMLHGVLHLLGMDHEADGGEMARAEVAWRKKLGLPAGLIERAGA
jgi:probable rRNA maturation factor